MRKALVLGTAAASLAGLALAAPAANAAAGDTPVSFVLTGGALAIDVPSTTATLTGSALSLAGASVSGALGTVTVTDGRGGITAWNTTIKGTSFTNGTTVIPVGNAKAFVAGVSLNGSPTGVLDPTNLTGTVTATAAPYVTDLTGLALTTSAQTFVRGTSVLGLNSAAFNPSLSVAVPGNATAGTYTGTVTQTVS